MPRRDGRVQPIKGKVEVHPAKHIIWWDCIAAERTGALPKLERSHEGKYVDFEGVSQTSAGKLKAWQQMGPPSG